MQGVVTHEVVSDIWALMQKWGGFVGSWFIGLFLLLGTAQAEKKLSLEQLFKTYEFSSHSLSGLKWMPEKDSTSAYTYKKINSKTGKIDIWASEVNGTEYVLVDGSALDFPIVNYEISTDRMKILLTGQLPARDIKHGGDIYLYDRVKGVKRLTITPPGESKPMLSHISPDGTKIAYVKNHNIYLIDLDSNEYESIALTADGSEDVRNGNLDWAYEEEFGLIEGWKWSPDSSKILYYQIDQRGVPSYPLINYESAHPKVTWIRLLGKTTIYPRVFGFLVVIGFSS